MTRSVSRVREPDASTHIGVIGFIVALGSLLILLPLLPIIIVLWAVDRIWGGERSGAAMERVDVPSLPTDEAE